MEDKARTSNSEEANVENSIPINAMVKDAGKLFWASLNSPAISRTERYMVVRDLSWRALKLGTRVVAQSTFTEGAKTKLKMLHDINESIENTKRDIDSRIEAWNELDAKYRKYEGSELDNASLAIDRLNIIKSEVNDFSERIENLKSFKYRLGQVAIDKVFTGETRAKLEPAWKKSKLEEFKSYVEEYIRGEINEVDNYEANTIYDLEDKGIFEEFYDAEEELFFDAKTEEIEEEEFYDAKTEEIEEEKFYDAKTEEITEVKGEVKEEEIKGKNLSSPIGTIKRCESVDGIGGKQVSTVYMGKGSRNNDTHRAKDKDPSQNTTIGNIVSNKR